MIKFKEKYYHLGGNFYIAKDDVEVVHVILDAAGTLDPFGIADAINASIYFAEGRLAEAAIAAVAIVPFAGDAVGKGGKYVAKVLFKGSDKVAEITFKNADELTKGLDNLAGKEVTQSVDNALGAAANRAPAVGDDLRKLPVGGGGKTPAETLTKRADQSPGATVQNNAGHGGMTPNGTPRPDTPATPKTEIPDAAPAKAKQPEPVEPPKAPEPKPGEPDAPMKRKGADAEAPPDTGRGTGRQDDAVTQKAAGKEAKGKPSAWMQDEFQGRRVFKREDVFDPNRLDDNGLTNVQRMEQGKAPIGFDNEPVNLHHLTGDEPGAIAEVGGKFHSENTKVLHIPQYEKVGGEWVQRKNYSFRKPDGRKSDWPRTKSGRVAETEAERSSKKWSSDYWKNRAKEFGAG